MPFVHYYQQVPIPHLDYFDSTEETIIKEHMVYDFRMGEKVSDKSFSIGVGGEELKKDGGIQMDGRPKFYGQGEIQVEESKIDR